ncbi:MAG: 50S ribosome-binding GTPase [Romboutsia sp.]|nr:50S ribosome-binding GTPase [Romboutsia sp.]
MLVGPTGVGKTTTITKLSTYLKQVKRKDVGLITLDTYREGAIAQLRDLCDYSNIEVEVANTKSDFENCLKKFSMKDFIFIDTAGRSQYDLSEIRKLYMTTDNGNIDDVCLVMSSSTKYKDMLEIYNSYKDLGVNKIIFSKIDETKEYGNLLSLVDTIDVPLAYLTTGQEVPNDIEKARESKLTELIFKNEDSLDFM